jgi:hypothetical protein
MSPLFACLDPEREAGGIAAPLIIFTVAAQAELGRVSVKRPRHTAAAGGRLVAAARPHSYPDCG